MLEEGVFRWARTGELCNFTNFDDNLGSFGDDQDCVYLYEYEWTWEDNECWSDSPQILCEMDPQPYNGTRSWPGHT